MRRSSSAPRNSPREEETPKNFKNWLKNKKDKQEKEELREFYG